MEQFSAEGYWLSRLLYVRGVGAIYLIAFLVAANQFRPLLGERGLLPVPRFVARVPFRLAPSIFHWRYSDLLASVVAWTGVALSALVVVGATERAAWSHLAAWLVLWVLYLSFVNVGQTFYGFGWESILLEAGVFAALLGPATSDPTLPAILLVRWLLFRVEFGAGLIKMRGDPCWRDLTCLYYHQETQPIPNRLSWYAHHLPEPLHRVEVLANHIAQLVVPFGLFLPQPIASIAAGIIVVTQGWLVLSGNFSWLNLVTIVAAIPAFSDDVLSWLLPLEPRVVPDPSTWFVVLVLAMTLLVAVLSYGPIRNMASRHQRMNASFNPFHFVGTYGAFGSITKVRHEIVLEWTDETTVTPETRWYEYEFKAKPGDPSRRPRQIAPYQLRLDWLMWFAAMSPAPADQWLLNLVVKLLEADPPTLRLLRRAPESRPTAIRAVRYRYRYTTPAERRATGDWWVRSDRREFLPPVRL